MDINFNSLNPLFARVFPTFKIGDEWIDLKDKTGKTDGVKQPHEVVRNTNDVGSDETAIDDQDIEHFLRENIANIPSDRLDELVNVLLDYVQKNPVGYPYCDSEDSIGAGISLSVIASYDTKYASQIINLLSGNNFLIRWAAVNIISNIENKNASFKEAINNLYAKEQENQDVTNQPLDIKTSYYQIDELYAQYLSDLKFTMDLLNK
jgi:hypothetical protein